VSERLDIAEVRPNSLLLSELCFDSVDAFEVLVLLDSELGGRRRNAEPLELAIDETTTIQDLVRLARDRDDHDHLAS
jgi:acyl carrier protein